MECVDGLNRAAEALAGLATDDDRVQLAAVRARIADRRLRIMAAGEVKRGKSTVVNQLLGYDLLPTGVIPVTAIVTTVRSSGGESEQLVVRYTDGRRERAPVAAPAGPSDRTRKPTQRPWHAEVEVLLVGGLVSRYPVEIVDTPGTGSVFEHNTEAATQALESLDAAVVVLTADPPVSAAERDLLTRIGQYSVRGRDEVVVRA